MMSNAEIDYSKMKQVYIENVEAERQYYIEFNKFLDEQGITEEQFYQRIEDIQQESFDKTMELNNKMNRRYKKKGYFNR